MKSSVFWDITPCSTLTLSGLRGDTVSQKVEFFKTEDFVLGVNYGENYFYINYLIYLLISFFLYIMPL
jgi:hypothetical protein